MHMVLSIEKLVKKYLTIRQNFLFSLTITAYAQNNNINEKY